MDDDRCARWNTYNGRRCKREAGHKGYHVAEHDAAGCNSFNGYDNGGGFGEGEHVCPEYPHDTETSAP